MAANPQFSGLHIGAILLTLLAFVLLLLLTARTRAGRRPTARPLPTFDRTPVELGRSAERGASLHVVAGSAGIGGERTMASLAALDVLDGLADQAAAYGTPPVVTVGDPTMLPLAEDVLRRAHVRRGTPERYNPAMVRFVATHPAVYAAGAADVTSHERVYGNVMVGSFDQEASLVAHVAEVREQPQIAAVDRLGSLAALYPAVTSLAMGEEMYAAAARLAGRPHHLASLQVQDVLRILVLVIIVLTVLGLF